MNFIPQVSKFKGSNPFLGKILAGTSALTAFLAAVNYFQSKGAEAQIQFRKEQLSKPIYRLSEEEMIHPPWNSSNIHEWLYRRVEVKGRPIHRLQCLVPRITNGDHGFEYVLPLVAKENKDRSVRSGLIFSKGFLPKQYQHIGTRLRIEKVEEQTFVGFVSQLPELQSHGIFEGNAYQDGRQLYTYANIDDFVRTANFENYNEAKVAIVERLHETGDLNERRKKHNSNDADFAEDYPYAKTEAGALQLPKMPWDYKNAAKLYFGTSIASFIVAASVF